MTAAKVPDQKPLPPVQPEVVIDLPHRTKAEAIAAAVQVINAINAAHRRTAS